MTEYPIPVRELIGDKALTIICERCHAEAVISPDDLINDDCYECPADTERRRKASTEGCCRGSACMKYWQGDVCPGCGTLGFFGSASGYVLKGACSRKCMLVAEYAESLKSAEARPGQAGLTSDELGPEGAPKS